MRVDVLSEREFYVDQQKLMSTIINNVGLGRWPIMMGIAALVRGVEHAVQRRREPRARDRDAARARIRRLPGGDLGAGRGDDPRRRRRPASAACSRCVFLNGMHSSTMNWASFSQMTFAFTVTPKLMLHGHHLRTDPDASSLASCRASGRRGCPSRRACENCDRSGMDGFTVVRRRWHWPAPLRFPRRRRPTDWSDVEGRIQYAYYTNDARALEQRAHLAQAQAGRGRGRRRGRRRGLAPLLSRAGATTGSRRCWPRPRSRRRKMPSTIAATRSTTRSTHCRRCRSVSTRPPRRVASARRATRSARPARSRAAR